MFTKENDFLSIKLWPFLTDGPFSPQKRPPGRLTWSDHDLVLLGAHPQEGEVVLGVDVPHRAAGLHHQLVDQACVLRRAGPVQSRLDGDS